MEGCTWDFLFKNQSLENGFKCNNYPYLLELMKIVSNLNLLNQDVCHLGSINEAN